MAIRKEGMAENVAAGSRGAILVGVADANSSIWIPLDKLKDSPKNVRTVPHTKAHIRTLAALIDAHGQLYPLIVEPELAESGEPTDFSTAVRL